MSTSTPNVLESLPFEGDRKYTTVESFLVDNYIDPYFVDDIKVFSGTFDEYKFTKVQSYIIDFHRGHLRLLDLRWSAQNKGTFDVICEEYNPMTLQVTSKLLQFTDYEAKEVQRVIIQLPAYFGNVREQLVDRMCSYLRIKHDFPDLRSISF